MLQTLIQPDGQDRFQICVSSFAGINPVGARLYKLTESQRQKHRIEIPSLENERKDRENLNHG